MYRIATSVIRFGKRTSYKVFLDMEREKMKKYIRKHKGEFDHIEITYTSDGKLCWYNIILKSRGE